MLSFADFYISEKIIDTKEFKLSSEKSPKDKVCMNYGQTIADRFNLILNGWAENTFYFTIPPGVPNADFTFAAHNENQILDQLQKRFPLYLEYIMKKNFPDGYEIDPGIPSDPPTDCEPRTMAQLKAAWARGEE